MTRLNWDGLAKTGPEEKVITVENCIQCYLEHATDRTEAEFREYHQAMLDRFTDYVVPSTEEVLETLGPILQAGERRPS